MPNFASRLRFIRRFRRDASGATAVEYALICAFVVVVLAAAVGALGTQLISLFTSVQNAFPT